MLPTTKRSLNKPKLMLGQLLPADILHMWYMVQKVAKGGVPSDKLRADESIMKPDGQNHVCCVSINSDKGKGKFMEIME